MPNINSELAPNDYSPRPQLTPNELYTRVKLMIQHGLRSAISRFGPT